MPEQPGDPHDDSGRQASVDPLRSEQSGRVIASGDLLGGESEVLIEHEGGFYRLRLTRSGKLILHK